MIDNLIILIALKERMKAYNLTFTDIALRMGWITKTGKAEGGRVCKALGLVKYDSRGYKLYKTRMHTDTARELLDTVNLIFAEIGL